MRTRIDVHHHLLTSPYLEELARVGVVESGGVPFPRWTPEDALLAMDRAKIQAALLSLSSPGLCFGNASKEREFAHALNEFAADAPEAETSSAPARLAALPGLSEQELQAIEGENALKLFPRLR